LLQINSSETATLKILETLRCKLGTSLSVKAYEMVRFNDNFRKKSNDFSRFDWQILCGMDVSLMPNLLLDCRFSYSIIPFQDRYHNAVLWASLQWYLT